MTIVQARSLSRDDLQRLGQNVAARVRKDRACRSVTHQDPQPVTPARRRR